MKKTIYFNDEAKTMTVTTASGSTVYANEQFKLFIESIGEGEARDFSKIKSIEATTTKRGEAYLVTKKDGAKIYILADKGERLLTLAKLKKDFDEKRAEERAAASNSKIVKFSHIAVKVSEARASVEKKLGNIDEVESELNKAIERIEKKRARLAEEREELARLAALSDEELQKALDKRDEELAEAEAVKGLASNQSRQAVRALYAELGASYGLNSKQVKELVNGEDESELVAELREKALDGVLAIMH